jgi:tyrosinase
MYVRREVRSLGPGDETLPAYARAVAAMKELEPTNPLSWAYQAAIHGSHVEPPEALWNQCKHGSWFFPPWHRMYLYYFEQIVRDAVIATGGPEDWALPYWNYGLNGENASIPDAFREPTDAEGNENPLYVEARRPGINEGGIIPPAMTTDAFALSRPNYTGAAEFGGGEAPSEPQFWNLTGRLEQTPHNDIHNAVGGEEGWMADPATAAQDPIFWLHHANIDRIWAEWNAAGHVDPEAAQWTGQGFELFDAQGQMTTLVCSEVEETTALEYTYDTLPVEEGGGGEGGEPPEPPARAEAVMASQNPSDHKVVGATTEALTLVGNSEQVPVSIDERAKEEVAAATSESDPRRLFLNLEDIKGETNPGSVYGIYVNLPPDADAETLARHHVGNLSFFGIERAKTPRDDEHSHGLRVSVEVGEKLREIGVDPGEKVDVTLRPLSLLPGPGMAENAIAAPSGEDPPVKIGRVSLTVA